MQTSDKAASSIPPPARRPEASDWRLVLADVLLMNLGFVLAYVIRYVLQWFFPVESNASLLQYLPIQILFTLVLLLAFRLDGVYASRRRRDWFDRAYRIINGAAKALIVLLAVIFFYGALVYSRLMLVQAAVLAATFCIGLRLVLSLVRRARTRQESGLANVLIVGAGELGRAVMRVVVARPDLGLRCIGFVDDDIERGSTSIGRFEALGPCSRVPEILSTQRVDEMVITLPWSAQEKISELVHLCNANNVRARVTPSLLQMNLDRIDVDDYGGIPTLSASVHTPGEFDLVIKRMIDIVIASFVLLIMSPILLFLMLAIRLESPGSPLFAQTRIGRDAKPFTLYKLRSMRADAEQGKQDLMQQNEADGPLFKMRHDPRTTRIGRLIRRSSIDELTQFWNVLRGDMSIVGPRPHVPQEVENYADWHKPRLSATPGITGLPQISGRSELAFDETVLLDLYYIENWSLGLDARIMLRTPVYLLTARGAY